MKKWPHEEIVIGKKRVFAAAPYIVSASRATDIPAFYADEFVSWLKRGWCVSTNPFSGVRTPVVFSRCALFVFWSKNPEPLIRHLPEIAKKVEMIFQFTLNDYDAEGYERAVPSCPDRMDTFIRLSRLLGKDRVIWRYDPVLLSDSIDTKEAAKRICRVGDRIHPYTSRLIFSFIKIQRYHKVRRNILRHAPAVRELTDEEKEAVLTTVSAHSRRNWGISITSCGTPDIYEPYGISAPGCISYSHVASLGISESGFNAFYGYDAPVLFDGGVPRAVRARGQQPLCGCIQSKDIGIYDTCSHGCLYCYATLAPKS
ncbi:MAG: DUF1848 family protein [Spirochaetota bacterium]